MRDLAPLRLLGLVFVTLLAVAFATGTAVRAAPSVSEVQLEAYQLQGGLLADLCNEKSPDHAHMAGCSLCHLVAGCDLPDATLSLVEIDRKLIAAVILPQIERAAAHPRDPATPTRGPPEA
ncbi:hypothetical protein [Falsirhodobacter xinxiangensis]|uniref:hypothetical protein n=1 Tax=Falsirhodobacter xinxiangensis TaxID=2530049 RepID=UPI0010A9E565|nr:hypothetical protein [Rhodobacter xinxiangensis]